MPSYTAAGQRLPEPGGCNLAFVYDTTVDPLAENNTHTFTLDFVGYNKYVLEVGCATGYFTKALSDRGCRVVGIEFDPEAAAVAEKWAERVIVGDLDVGTLWRDLEGEQFDAITFGDVLEHLRDPLATLRAAVRTLKPSGIVAISIPNIAHGDVRMALLEGDFKYHETGLLDRTHLRFFTKSELWNLVRDAGLVPVHTRRVITPLFQSELAVERETVSPATIKEILEDPEAETYQFVVKAILDNGSHALATLVDRVHELSEQADNEVVRTALLRKEMQELEIRTHDYERLLEALTVLRDELADHEKTSAEHLRLLGDHGILEENYQGLSELHEKLRGDHESLEHQYQGLSETLNQVQRDMNQMRHDKKQQIQLLRRELYHTDGLLQDVEREREESERQAEEYRRQLEEIRGTKTFRMVAPLRRVYGRMRRVGGPKPAPPEPT